MLDSAWHHENRRKCDVRKPIKIARRAPVAVDLSSDDDWIVPDDLDDAEETQTLRRTTRAHAQAYTVMFVNTMEPP